MKCTMLDITETKKGRRSAQRERGKIQDRQENSNDGISILKGDICQYANRQYIKMFEFDSPENVIGKSIKSTIHPDDLDMVNGE